MKKKMLKSVLCLLLAAALLCGLTACGEDEELTVEKSENGYTVNTVPKDTPADPEAPAQELTGETEPVETEAPEEPTVFAEAYHWNFEAPHALTVPVAISFDNPELIREVTTAEASVSAPVITRSEADDEGYVTYTVTYSEGFNISLYTEPESIGHANLSCEDYYLYDLHTGYLIKAWQYMDEDHKETSLTTNISYDGVTYPVEFTLATEKAVNPWEIAAEGDGYRKTLSLETPVTMTIRVPQEYDGLAMGINYVDAPEISAEDVAEVVTWDANQDPEHWTFIRLDDWLSEADAE